MSSKSSTTIKSTSNGNGHGTETSYENPTISQRSSKGFESNSGSETEVEEVQGFISRPWENDQEVSNGEESAAAESYVETSLEESGTSLSGSEAQLLDAFYASYSDLISEAREQMAEVIIGPDNRVRINPTTSYPWRAICGLKITAKNGSRWIGTGW